MTIAEYDAYITSVNEIEERIIDDDKYPVVRDNKIKICCKYTLEITKLFINYLKTNINNEKKKTWKWLKEMNSNFLLKTFYIVFIYVRRWY